MSVSPLVCLQTYRNQANMGISPYLVDIFIWNFCTIDPNNFEFLACLSVCQLAYLITKILSIQIYLQFCMRYLAEICWRLSWDVCILDPNNLELFVFLSVCQLAYFLTRIRQMQGFLQFWMRYLSETFQRCTLICLTLVRK